MTCTLSVTSSVLELAYGFSSTAAGKSRILIVARRGKNLLRPREELTPATNERLVNGTTTRKSQKRTTRIRTTSEETAAANLQKFGDGASWLLRSLARCVRTRASGKAATEEVIQEKADKKNP